MFAEKPTVITLPDGVLRGFFSVGALSAALALLIHLLFPATLPGLLRGALLVGYGVITVACLLIRRLSGEALRRALL
ncbi:MAG: hypothetical protein HY021_04290, partial [Burkholderiales bacterium]|nr:hypothetical protein [Burkholderiales bacterium]